MKTALFRRRVILPALLACLVSSLTGLSVSALAASADLWQARNGTPTSPKSPVQWAKGNAGPSNSHFVEGHSIPYRMVMSGLTNGHHTLVIEWDTMHKGKHAIDYVTHYDRLAPHSQFGNHVTPETINPLEDITGSFGTPNPFPIPSPSAKGSPLPGQPATSFQSLPVAERVMTIWNGTITSLSYLNEEPLDSESGATRLAIEFVAADKTVVIAWGGHIASSRDWGSGNSAISIWGSPYHTRKIELDGGGGNQDRSLQALAVSAPPTCVVAGPTTVCTTTTNTYSLTTDAKDPTGFQWSLANNTAGAIILGATNSPSVEVIAGSAGTYSLEAVVFVGNGKGTRTYNISVTPATSIAPLLNQTVCPNSEVIFTVVPSGTAPFTFTWSKDGLLIPDATNNSLVLGNITAASGGLYCATAIGACGSASSCASLTVEAPPVLVGPPDLARECFADVPQPDPSSVLVFGGYGSVTVSHAGDVLQTNTAGILVLRTYQAVDSCASLATCQQTIAVVDTIAPQITCAPDSVLLATDATGAIASFQVTATDVCDASVQVNCVPPSGSVFSPGATTVHCVATDASGNTNVCSFQVRVVPRVVVANSTADSGPGSLRQALLDANAAPGSNVVAFAFTGTAPYIIHLLSSLPAITDPVMIDGWSQLEFRGQPVIELDGSNAIPSGFVAASEGAVVAGLDIVAGDSEVRGLALNGFEVGIRIAGSGGNIIQGNFIGTDASGSVALGNISDGIRVHSASNLIGGNAAAARNVISGNQGNGVALDGSNVVNNVVRGNLIGPADDSLLPLGNGQNGVVVRNGAANNLVGPGNIIAFSALNGVLLEPSAGNGNGIRGNSIFSNGALGIDLGGDGVTPNDDEDADTGPNQLQNIPVLTFAQSSGETTIIAGTLNGTSNSAFQIDFFLNPTAVGSGETFLGSATVETDANGHANFSVTLPVTVSADQFITATATDSANNTSEFSLAAQVGGAPVILTHPVGSAVEPGASLTVCVTAAGSQPLAYQWRLNGANIPDATNTCFTIENAQLTDGGSYTVVVANDLGVVTSEPAVLRLILPPVPAADNFVERVLLSGVNGLVAWNNNNATREPGEPNHAGKPGGRSIWYKWTAPSTGVATFSAIGSAFDTLLAVYVGGSVSNLTLVESDEDRGGFFTSIVRFNARAGTEYQIAIDGFGGASGEFVFGWDFVTTTQLLPVISNPPVNQTVVAGSTVTFSVNARVVCPDKDDKCREWDKDDKNPKDPKYKDPLSYQWYLNGVAIPGANQSSLTVANVQEINVGIYTVQVTGENKQSVETQPVSLQINETGPNAQNVQAKDKFLDAANSTPLILGTPATLFSVSADPGETPISAAAIVRSYTSTQVFSSAGGTTSEGERLLCYGVGGASEWFAVVTEEPGTLFVNTDGSSYDTVMAVYTYAPANAGLALLGCDNNGGKDGKDSALSVPVQAGQTNFVVIDGYNGASGVASLHFTLVTPGSLKPNGFTAQKAFKLRLTGQPAMRFTIQASSNLVNWTPLLTNSSATGSFDYTDPKSTNAPRRFYRALMLP